MATFDWEKKFSAHKKKKRTRLDVKKFPFRDLQGPKIGHSSLFNWKYRRTGEGSTKNRTGQTGNRIFDRTDGKGFGECEEREREQSDPDQIFLSSSEKLGHRAWSSGSRDSVRFRVVPSRDQNSLDECKRWPSDSRYPWVSPTSPNGLPFHLDGLLLVC